MYSVVKPVCEVDVGSIFNDQASYHSLITLLHSEVKRRGALLISPVHISAEICKQASYHSQIALSCCRYQWSEVKLVRLIDVGTEVIHLASHHFELAVPHCMTEVRHILHAIPCLALPSL
jgi:hypothetical protein